VAPKKIGHFDQNDPKKQNFMAPFNLKTTRKRKERERKRAKEKERLGIPLYYCPL